MIQQARILRSVYLLREAEEVALLFSDCSVNALSQKFIKDIVEKRKTKILLIQTQKRNKDVFSCFFCV